MWSSFVIVRVVGWVCMGPNSVVGGCKWKRGCRTQEGKNPPLADRSICAPPHLGKNNNLLFRTRYWCHPLYAYLRHQWVRGQNRCSHLQYKVRAKVMTSHGLSNGHPPLSCVFHRESPQHLYRVLPGYGWIQRSCLVFWLFEFMEVPCWVVRSCDSGKAEPKRDIYSYRAFPHQTRPSLPPHHQYLFFLVLFYIWFGCTNRTLWES